jgi:hypothetical protein
MTTISEKAEHQTVITIFEVTPATCHKLLVELERTFEECIRHQKGFTSAALHVNDARTRVANYSQWDDRKDFQGLCQSNFQR